MSSIQNFRRNLQQTDAIFQDKLVLSQDKVLAKSTLNHVLQKSEYLMTMQTALELQRGILGWYKELKSALDSVFYNNDKYANHTRHIFNILLEDGSMRSNYNAHLPMDMYKYSGQAQQNAQSIEETTVSQLKTTSEQYFHLLMI